MARDTKKPTKNNNGYAAIFGVDIPIDEARQRFSTATKEEMNAEDTLHPMIPDGELELVPFKGTEIRRVCHNDEWWYSVIDVVGALVETDRPSKYWTDLKTKVIEEEGFSELSDKIGKLRLTGADC